MLQSPSRIEELVKIFIHAIKVRIAIHSTPTQAPDTDAVHRWRLAFGRCSPTSDTTVTGLMKCTLRVEPLLY